jgi:hypothetical protein
LFKNAIENKLINYWWHILHNYDCEIIHLPGVNNVIPDYLSRLYSQSGLFPLEVARQGMELDNHSKLKDFDMEVRKPSDPCYSSMKDVNEEHESINLHQLMVDDRPHNFSAKTLESLLRDVADKICPDIEQRSKILQKYHDRSHQGAYNLYQEIWYAGYFWPGILKDCRRFVLGCKSCLAHTVHRAGFHPLRPMDAMYPLDIMGVDTFVIGDSIESDGFSGILIATDYASSFSFLLPVKAATADCVVAELNKLFGLVGKPLEIRGDNGREFVNSLFTNFLLEKKILWTPSPPEHHQGNGKVEAHVKIAKKIFLKLLNNELHLWNSRLPDVQFAMNTRITSKLGSTPFSLIFARNPNDPDDCVLPTNNFNEKEWVERGKLLTEVIYPATNERAQQYNEKMKQRFAESHRILTKDFPKGSYVYRRDSSRTSKAHDLFVGPYQVVVKLDDGAYLLRDGSGKFPSSVPAEMLKLALVSDKNQKSEDIFEVEKILSHKGPANRRQFKVRWKGYGEEDDSWVKAEDLNAPELLRQYFGLKRTVSKRGRGK